jgi:hypothetical protein
MRAWHCGSYRPGGAVVDRLQRSWKAARMARYSTIVLALSMAFAALAAGAVRADPGQRGQPARVDAGGLLRVDPSYFDMAAQTGGDFYFWAPGEFARAGLQLPLHDDAVLLAYGRFDGPRRSFDIPVESGVRTLTIFAGAQRRDRAVLVRPGGAIVADGAAGVKLQTFSHMTIATIQAPAPGNWRIDFAGAGMFSVSAHLKPSAEHGAASVNDLAFVEWGGRPAHEGWFPIQRELRKGESITCQLEVSGATSGVQVAFVTGDNRPIATVPMDSGPGESGHYLGRCVVPGEPFRVVVTGRDQMGQVFRRTTSALRAPL